jgi:S1-C subfamily serine protease
MNDGSEHPSEDQPTTEGSAVTPPQNTEPTPTVLADANPAETSPISAPDGFRVPPPMPPSSAYAMGALAGNPNLAPPTGPGYGTPPPYGTPPWGAPSAAPPVNGRPPHRFRNGALITGAAVIALAAGIGIGHSAWKDGTNPTKSASGNSGNSGSQGNAPSNPFGSGPSSSGSSGSSGSSSTTTNGPKDVSAIADKVDPGLVDINTTLGYSQEQAAGTGIVLSSNGEILTNNHVIDGATTISVTDVGNGKTYSANVVGYDRTQDIAVLQLKGASGLTTADIGNSNSASAGQDVVGIGNAGGTGGTPSAAGGTITALGKSITASDSGDGSSEQLTNLIETNANIQAGDSGGSLVNTSGKVIGIDTAASAGFSFQSEGQEASQSYAIPINEAIAIAKEIELDDATSLIHIGPTGFLGVEILSSSAQGGSNQYPGGYGGFGSGGGYGGSNGASTTSGAEVAGTITSSPAQDAGLAQGDVITAVDGKTVTDGTDLTNDLEPYHPGDKVKLTWVDTSDNSHSATVSLTSGPPQ